MFESNVDRRSFLRGSALFAAAIGLKIAAPAAAQRQDDQSQQKPQEKKGPSEDKGGSTEKTYTDKEGRAYRICPQCAYNMYKQGRMWICDNCGYSYVE